MQGLANSNQVVFAFIIKSHEIVDLKINFDILMFFSEGFQFALSGGYHIWTDVHSKTLLEVGGYFEEKLACSACDI